MAPTPDVVPHHYAAGDSADLEDLLACFADDAHVHDEDRDHPAGLISEPEI